MEDEGSLAFGQRFGFVETGRQVEQVRPIGAESWPDPPTAYEIVTVAERPELWATAYEHVAQPTLPDMDTPTPVEVSARGVGDRVDQRPGGDVPRDRRR